MNTKFQRLYQFKQLILTLIIYHLLTFLASGQTRSTSFEISPGPFWIRENPLPQLKKSYSPDLVLVHAEVQYNHIKKETFIRNFFYLNTLIGVNRIRSFNFSYKPDFQKVNINNVTIYRKGKTISLSNQLHVEHIFNEKQIGGQQYDSDASVYIFLNQARTADMVEIQ